MYPHERSLVKRLADKPFALIGVNSDRDREQLKETLQAENITWRSFWNGGSTGGPISTRWNVRGWPSLYLLNDKGIIRGVLKMHIAKNNIVRIYRDVSCNPFVLDGL